MMRPMKLAGSELMFGEGCLEYIKTIKAEKVSIVVGGKSMEKSGMLAKVEGYFHEVGAETMVISGVEPDPSFETVMRGAQEMLGSDRRIRRRVRNGCCKSNVDLL